MMPDAKTVIQISYLEALTSDTLKRQKQIKRARDYYNGKQIVFLTARMREYLNLGSHNIDDFRLNIIQTIVMAVEDELSVNGFDTSEKAGDDGVKPQAAWARKVWDFNRMSTIQHQVHEAALRDCESFVLVDYDQEAKMPRFTWHEEFVDVEAGGPGCGIWLVYEQDDYTQPIKAAVKEWVETIEKDNRPYTRRRRNVYFRDRIEKYVLEAGWQKWTNDGAEAWPTPWVDPANKPLGIPVICFPNFGHVAEATEALPQQDAINKLLLDILGEADGAFRMYFLSGMVATTDGQALKEDGSNQLKIGPMTMISTNNPEAKLDTVEGGDPTKLMSTLKDIILLVAQITGTPVSYFIVTKQIAGPDTLKGQDKPLTKKVIKRKEIFGQSWADVMTMARRLANAFGAAALDENVAFYTVWAQVFDLETIQMMRDTLGLPKETLWRMYGLSEEQIQAAKATDEYKLTKISLEMQELELEKLRASVGQPTDASTLIDGANNTDNTGA